MTNKITVDVEEAKRVFLLLDAFHDFLHQPMNYPNTAEFANKNYEELKHLYYDVVWNWLPSEMQKNLEDR